MNIFGTEFTTNHRSRETEASGGETPPEPIPVQTLRGGDASDIVPEDLLRKRVAERRDDENVVETARAIRGEFASLQRILETRIARYDAELEMVYEDTELIIYRLGTNRDFETMFEFCEIEKALFKRVILELMQTIAAEKTASDVEYPLVVRKPTAFRAGERHARARLTGYRHRRD